jgi:Homocysteine S-methyltransferase
MARYRAALPQLGGRLCLTDGGIETTLIFQDGLDLPDFAAFHLLRTPEGEAGLRRYFRTYAEIARQLDTGLILESATWRASADWGARLGYTPEALTGANREAIRLLEQVRGECETTQPLVISGCLGPRGDGYVADSAMSEREAEAYHRQQVETFAGSAADMVCEASRVRSMSRRAHYAVIFDAKLKRSILAAKADDLRANWQGVMFDDGRVWFGPVESTLKIVTINPPARDAPGGSSP